MPQHSTTISGMFPESNASYEAARQAAAIVEAVLAGLPSGTLAALPEHGNLRARFADQAAVVLRVTDTGEPGYDVMVDASTGAALPAALRSAGAVAVDAAAADVLR